MLHWRLLQLVKKCLCLCQYKCIHLTREGVLLVSNVEFPNKRGRIISFKCRVPKQGWEVLLVSNVEFPNKGGRYY